MPVYDYKCPDHGVFNELAMMSESSKPCECPQCGLLSPRVVMIAPEVLDMAPARRQAQAANEKAQHQPIISTVDARAEAAEIKAFYAKREQSKKSHKSGCGCGSHHGADPDRSSLKQQVVFLPDGSKVFPSQRPWMISH